MVSPKQILLITATAALASAATVSQVVQDIQVLDGNVKALTASVSTYTGGFVAALPQLIAIIPVYTSLLQGVTDSGTLPTSLTAAEAYEIINVVNATLAVDNPIAVDTLVGKKSLYEAAGLDDFLVAGLGLLLLGHESFTNNVLQRIPANTSADGIAVTDVISEALTYGIHVFESK